MDPIANMLSAIKNGIMSGRDFVVVRESKIIMSICKILVEKKVIFGYEQIVNDNKKLISITLNPDKKPYHLKRVSKPSCRIYIKSKDIRAPLSGIGFYIISAPCGLITDKEARKLGVGGELICEIW